MTNRRQRNSQPNTSRPTGTRLERTVAQLEERRDALREEVADLGESRRQVDRSRQLLDQLHIDIAGARTELDGLRPKPATRLERTVAQLEEQRDALREEVSDLTEKRRQVDRSRLLLDQLHIDIAGARAEIETLQPQITGAEQDLRRRLAELDASYFESILLVEDNELLRQERGRLQDQTQAASVQREATRNQTTQLEQRIVELNADIE